MLKYSAQTPSRVVPTCAEFLSGVLGHAMMLANVRATIDLQCQSATVDLLWTVDHAALHRQDSDMLQLACVYGTRENVKKCKRENVKT